MRCIITIYIPLTPPQHIITNKPPPKHPKIYPIMGVRQVRMVGGRKLIINTNFSVFEMSNFYGLHEKESKNSFSNQKQREGLVSSYIQSKQQHSKYPTSPTRFIQHDSSRGNDTLPPRAVPFRRSSHNTSRQRIQQTRQQSADSSRRVDGRMKSLEKIVHQQSAEKERLRALNSLQEQQIKKLNEDLAKAREERVTLNAENTHLKQQLLASEKNLLKSSQTIESLNKTLRECRINQKSLTNLKNIQTQLETLQQRNAKLTQQNQLLVNNHRNLEHKIQQKDSKSQSEGDKTKDEKIKSLQLQIKRLKEELHRGRSERQLLLQSTLRELQRKLYQKQNEIRKISIQLNFVDRKKYISIDQVKNKKDQEIKDLRQRFMKVSKDLKQTKDKFQQHEKKKTPKKKAPCPRRVKSSNLLGTASESQELTFELSSEI